MTKTIVSGTNGISRRNLLITGAAGVASIGFPAVLRAQPATIRIGVQHPVTGFLAYSGGQCRTGATMAIDAINAAGGIKSLGGAKLEAVLSDNQSKVDVGLSEFEKLAESGVSAFVGPYASAIGIATSQAATRYNLPHVCDLTTSDLVISKDKPSTFRFSPGYGQIAREAVERLVKINDAAGKPVKTVMLVHEESETGSGAQKRLIEELPKHNFEIVDTILHPNPMRDFTNIVLRIKQRQPDLLMIGNFYNEYVLLVRTLHQQKVQLKGIYSVIGGGATSFRFLRESPEAAQYAMDCNHWYNPKSQKALDLRKKVEAAGLDFSYELWLNYNAIELLADALERAGSDKRDAIVAALASSTFKDHMLPYGPTKFVNGQNTGALSSNLQVLGNNIELILPEEFSSAKPVFPRPA
ncbi:ABC transporter substrate-binding protein [Microvirga soli]|uniref:ABC transporter substrate-binding protein n=1 Tax=Microvirga soli TaxID=1854496 RepID=UPI00191FEB8A|nr:ABC transporter substrate-binding protein [Microvirga soli]